MKRIISFSIIFLFFLLKIQASEITDFKDGTVSGKVIDAVLNQPLPYVNILINNAEGKTITGGITDENGEFKVTDIPEGSYLVTAQYIGYKSESKEITITRGNFKIDLGEIALTEEAEGLDEVTVIAETSSVVQKIDRKVVNVGKDLTSAGTTASELLNNVQSVSVDSQTGNISLRGNENVRILVDGKPTSISPAQLLKQIPSTSIKQIELITNPSAKYNPEGMSGIINIILHKNANQGFNGNVNLGITQGENTRYNGSVDMNYKTGKVNFYTNYGYNSGKQDNYGYVQRLDNNSLQEFEFDSDNTSHLIKFGADVYLNEKNTLSAYTIQNRFDGLAKGNTMITDNGTLVVDTYTDSDNESNSQTYNFNYQLEFDKEGHELEFEADYSKSKSPEYAEYIDFVEPSDMFLNYTNDVKNVQKNNQFNLDYTNPLSENAKLELGLEYRNNTTDNDSDTTQYEYVLDENGNQIPDGNGGFETQQIPHIAFGYDRDIYSAYINYNQQFDKVSIQAGARFEEYEVDGTFIKGTETEKVTDEIFSIYPSAFVTYNPSEKNQFQVSYSRRVDRPSLGQVNPIREWSTPRVTSVGNPDLKPQFTNSYEFNYTRQIKNGSVSFGTFYRRVSDNINRILNIDPLDEDKVLLSYTNYASSNRYGFEASANYKFTKWWNSNASAELYLQKESGVANGTELEVTNNSFNARINNNFKASENLRFQLFYMFRGGGKSIQFERKSMSMVNIGASLNVLDKKGTISFRVNDVFKGMRFKFEALNPYPSVGQFNWESRTAYLGFAYRFGGGKNRALRRKNRDDNETSGSGGFL